MKQQAYAKLPSERTFEFELPVVWKGIEAALKDHKITDRDPDEVDPLEANKIKERSLETDWVYTQSRDKYQEYTVNSLPMKKYLQARIRYSVRAVKQLGGTTVSIKAQEEIERLKSDGSPDGYSSIDPDPSRAHDLLEKIKFSILSAAP